ncbi:MAG: tyrosine-type recombinase/integrase [Pseudomonadales bacterium]|nr:tyrosine-type recombinase/integrase [Pseudomonadales bacterium]
MGRKRKTDLDLPQRWKRNHGAIYYIVPPGQGEKWDSKKWFKLGDDEAEAYRTWADRLDRDNNITTMDDLFDQYLILHTPTVRPKTQKHQRRAIANLRVVFGEINVMDFESQWAFKYYAEREQDGISAANQDVKTLSHVFSKAIEWGVIKNSDHPLRGLQIKKKDGVRDRYVEDWELLEAMTVAPEMIKLYICFKIITGMDKNMILNIRRQDITDKGILSKRNKINGKPRVYEWSSELKECVDRIKALPGSVGSMYLFSNRKGRPYVKPDATTSTFDSIWRYFMTNALMKTKLEKRFTAHDLRAKAASDADNLEIAQVLLGHSDSSITRKVYRRRPETVKVGKINKDILGS